MVIVGGILFWAFLGAWLFLIRPAAPLHRSGVSPLTGGRKLALALLAGGLIGLLGFVMTLCPIWNGEIPAHRNQYEKITEAFLEGRLDFGYEADPRLLEMENPYDAALREELGVEACYDHAFYNGKYYMYFGVVPVFLAFMPYRLITGHALVTWQATFLFTGIFILGLAIYLYWLAKRFFPKLSWGAYLSLLAVISLASTVYEAKYPAMYQTPVACGRMLEIWSLYCFSRAFLRAPEEDFPLGLAALGSLLGALTFGCRPPLAMANLLVIPLLIRFFRGRKISSRTILRLLRSFLPYALVAAGLMWYNAARFGSPFEFGQSYQMTFLDQSAYGSLFSFRSLAKAVPGVFRGLFTALPLHSGFPFLQEGNGAFALCPLLLLSFAFLLPGPRRALRKEGLFGLTASVIPVVLLIVALQIVWSPWLLDRYQSDYVYLLGLGAFCGVGACFSGARRGRLLSFLICLASFGCILLTALVFLIPYNASYTEYDADALMRIWRFISLKALR